MWQLSLVVSELNVNTPAEASKLLGPGRERGSRALRDRCAAPRMPPRRFPRTQPLLFFLACNWEWGKGSFAEGHDVFTAIKKKEKKSPESPQEFPALPQMPWKPSSMSQSPLLG